MISGLDEIQLSSIGFGAWAIGGGGWLSGWGHQDDDESTLAIRRALERGVNWIDTAPVYGLGHSEEIVGRALKGATVRPFVFTKCSRVWDEQGAISGVLAPQSLRREVEASLARLQTDTIDLMQVHWPVPDDDLERGWETLCELQAAGKIARVGICNPTVAQLKRIGRAQRPASVQAELSLLHRGSTDSLLPYCEANRIPFLAYSPLASGLLTGAFDEARVEALPADDWRKRHSDFGIPRFARNLHIVGRLREISRKRGASPADVALAWVLQQPGVTAAIVGLRSARQVDAAIDALSFRLAAEDLASIDDILI